VQAFIFSLLRLAPVSLRLLFPFASSLEDQSDDDEDDADAAGAEGAGGGEVGNAREENMKPCQFCRRPFRKERLAKHEEACKKKTKAIGQLSSLFFEICLTPVNNGSGNRAVLGLMYSGRNDAALKEDKIPL